jgi:hypothetical protein
MGRWALCNVYKLKKRAEKGKETRKINVGSDFADVFSSNSKDVGGFQDDGF